MNTSPLHLLIAGCATPEPAHAPYGPFVCRRVAPSALTATLADARFDALVVEADGTVAERLVDDPLVRQALQDSAVVVVVPQAGAALALALVQAGVHEVLDAAGADPERLARVLRLAIERQRLERQRRAAFATDLETGLPNRAQLLEHLTHLLALREREPAPMAAIVLRVDGLAAVEAALGAEAAAVLRRKAAVRLRAGLRASDVVASFAPDAFAVLLAWLDDPRDAAQVASKLARALALPFTVLGRSQRLAVSAGLASYPEHGKDAELLLRRALAQAATEAGTRVGTPSTEPAGTVDRGPDAAANDAA